MAAGLDVAGHLDILADDARIRVDFTGDAVVVDLPDLRAAAGLLRTLRRPRRPAWVGRVRDLLGAAGLELRVTLDGRPIGRLAADTRPGRLARLLKLGPMELHVRPLLARIARRRRSPHGDRPRIGS